MKKTKIIFILAMLLTIFFSLSAFATQTHFTYGNLGSAEGQRYVAFASNTPSNHNTSLPFVCQIGAPVEFSPVSGDLDNDGQIEIVFATTANDIGIYDFGCNEIQTIAFGEDIQSMPVIGNVDGDELFDIIVQGDTIIRWFEFQSNNSQYVPIDFMNTEGNDERGFNCDLLDNACMTVNFTGQRNMITYYLANKTTTVSADIDVSDYIEPPPTFSSFGMNRYTNTLFRDYAITVKDEPVGIKIEVHNTHNVLRQTCQITSLTDYSSLRFHNVMASLGYATTPNVLFSSGVTTAPASRTWGICDITGTLKVNGGFNTAGDVSNFAVGEFQRGFGNYGCLAYFNSSTNSDHIACYDAAFLRVFDEPVNLSDGYRGLAMADFDDSNNIMEFATVDGIYRYDTASDTFTLINNITSFVSNKNGQITVTESDTSRSNFAMYTESAKITIFGFAAQNVVTCGDGTCSGTESVFSCPQDCADNVSATLFGIGESCQNNSQCLSNVCFLTKCDVKQQGVECASNVECASGVCQQNQCTKPSMWAMVDALKTRLYGNDTQSNNFIVFMTIFGVMAGIILAGRASVASFLVAAITFYAGVVFFVSVGWLESWIFMIIIIASIILGVLALILKFAGGAS